MGQCRSPAGPKRRVSFVCVTVVLHESDWSQLSRPLSGIDRPVPSLAAAELCRCRTLLAALCHRVGLHWWWRHIMQPMLWPASRCQRHMGFASVVTGGWGFVLTRAMPVGSTTNSLFRLNGLGNNRTTLVAYFIECDCWRLVNICNVPLF